MKRFTKTSLAACMASALFAGSAHAALVTSSVPLGPATIIDFQQFTSVAFANTVPVQVGVPVGEDVELFGIGSSTFVGPISHNLGGNGQWLSSSDPNFLSASLPVSTATAMEFFFNDGPVRGVGAFVNYTPGYGPVLIEAFDIGGSLLESYNLVTDAPISTGSTSINQGAFRGIMRSTADIASFRYSGPWPVLDNLTFTRVPEPASASLLMVLGLTAIARRRRSQP